MELVTLDVEDRTERPEGLEVRIARSKTNQEGKGDIIAVPRVPDSPYCPAQVVLDWQVAADITTRPLLRRLHRGDRVGARLTAQSVSLCQAARLPSRSQSRRGIRRPWPAQGLFDLRRAQSRHKSLDVLREYVDDAERFEDHAVEGLLRRRRR